MFSDLSSVKSSLASNSLTVGAWITLSNAAIAEIYCRAGFDWVVVDLEHSIIDYNSAGELIRTIDLLSSCPLVRLSSIDPVQIKRLMDAGAHGVIGPNVTSVDEVQTLINSTRYAPDGCRGVGLARAQQYGANFHSYLNWQKTSPIVIPQIENISVLPHLKQILSTEGVDAFFIGPYDLSCSMGIPGEFSHPDFLDAMSSILSIARECNCPSGIHIVEPNLDTLKTHIDLGYKFIAYSVDIRMLDVASRDAVNYVNSLVS